MGLLFVYLGITLLVSFLCSVLEATLMSTTISYLTMREEEGYAPATKMLRYKTDTEQPLSAILALNTIANTIGAAGVGAQAAVIFGQQWVGVVSAIATLLILIVSEIIPKTIGTTYWRSLTGFAATMIQLLIVLMYPFVLLMHWVTKIFPETDEASVSREEVETMADLGEEEGVIEKDENRIISNVLHLDDVKAYDVMTPRVVASIAPESMTLKEYYDDDQYDVFSRIPVYADSPDYITGYILRDDALEDLAEDNFNRTLGDIKRPVPMFNEESSVGDIFDQMIKERSKIAVILDEYGAFQGILTMEDIIETIFGLEIVDEHDAVADLQAYAKERWQKQKQKQKRAK